MLLCFYGEAAHAQMADTKADSIELAKQFYEVGQEILKSNIGVTQARDYFEMAANLDAENIWSG